MPVAGFLVVLSAVVMEVRSANERMQPGNSVQPDRLSLVLVGSYAD